LSPLSLDLNFVNLHDVSDAIDSITLSGLVEFALRKIGARGEWIVAIVLTSDEHLRQLHRDFMGIDEETDVMTFPNGEDDSGGDIIVSVQRAAEQGLEAGLTVEEEIRFLVVHGLLHLNGWEDDTPERRVRMLARQSEIIAAFNHTNESTH
jgi:rRNA maturation RNase YbeY